jgi:sulfite reductase (NADPH) flavoprotein alpha-component
MVVDDQDAVGPRSCFAEDRGHPEHLTVAAVRYESHGRQCKGVASTFLADRVSVNDGMPMFVHVAKGFRLPVTISRVP